MNAPVEYVTIHNEGAGSPTDVPRGGAGGYTYWIGSSYWTRLRTPWKSYATYGYNHRSVDVCLSGDRMRYDVSDHDIVLIRSALMDARMRRYVIDHPTVQPHKAVYNTDCPGVHTMEVWPSIVAACLNTPDPSTTGELMTVLPVRLPIAKAGPRPAAGNRFAFFTHDDTHIICWNGARIYGDAPSGGTDADVNVGKVPSKKTVPVNGKIKGLTYATKIDGSLDLATIVAVSDTDGGTFTYKSV